METANRERRLVRNVQKLDESATMRGDNGVKGKTEISLGNPAHAAHGRRNNASRGTRETRVTDMRVFRPRADFSWDLRRNPCVSDSTMPAITRAAPHFSPKRLVVRFSKEPRPARAQGSRPSLSSQWHSVSPASKTASDLAIESSAVRTLVLIIS